MRANTPSTIAGTDVTRASTTANIITVTALQIASALPAITSQSLMIPTPICSIKYGISPIILDTNATMAAPLAARAPPKTVRPTANNKIPAPMVPIPIPNNTMDADNNKMVPTKGFNISPASPITTNAPAKVSKALPISARSIEPSAINTGVNTARAPATTNKAAAPNMAFFMAFMATAIIIKEPARATKPLAISSQDIVAMILRAPANITRLTAIIGRAKTPGMAFFMAFIAIVIIVSDPAKVTKLLAISFQDIVAMILRAPANITRLTAIIGRAKTPGMAFFMAFIAIVIIVSDPAKVTKLLAISFQDIVAMILRAPANITIDVAKLIIPIAFNAVFFGSKLTAATREAKPTTIPSNAIPISFRDIVLIIFKATERMRRAEHNFLIALADLVTFFSGSKLIVMTRAAKPTTIPSKATPISSNDIVLNILSATDKTNKAADNFTIAFEILFIDLKFFPSASFPNIAMAPNNSINKAVTAPSEAASLSESMRDNTNNEPANIAIDMAIVLSVLAFICPVNAFKASPTPSRMLFIFSTKSPALSVIPVRDLINFLMPTSIAANIPPLNRSNNVL